VSCTADNLCGSTAMLDPLLHLVSAARCKLGVQAVSCHLCALHASHQMWTSWTLPGIEAVCLGMIAFTCESILIVNVVTVWSTLAGLVAAIDFQLPFSLTKHVVHARLSTSRIRNCTSPEGDRAQQTACAHRCTARADCEASAPQHW
jgi:hypothetical protein